MGVEPYDMSAWVLLPATPDDLFLCRSWLRTEAHVATWTGDRFAFPLDQDVLVAHLAAANAPGAHARCFALRDAAGDRMIGYGELTNLDVARGRVDLSRIVVDPSVRGRGAGARLVDLLMVEGAVLGATCFSLRVFEQNGPAIHLYERLGFQPTGVSMARVVLGDQHWTAVEMTLATTGDSHVETEKRDRVVELGELAE